MGEVAQRRDAAALALEGLRVSAVDVERREGATMDSVDDLRQQSAKLQADAAVIEARADLLELASRKLQSGQKNVEGLDALLKSTRDRADAAAIDAESALLASEAAVEAAIRARAGHDAAKKLLHDLGRQVSEAQSSHDIASAAVPK